MQRDDKGQVGVIAPVGKGLAKGGKPNGVPYNFGKNSCTKGKGKMHKGLGFQPERGEQGKFGGYCNWCWRIRHKEAQCFFKQEHMKSNPSQDPLQRDIREWTRRGKVAASPKVKVKVKVKVKAGAKRKHPGKGNHNQDRLDLRVKKLDSARWVTLVKNVRELKFSGMSTRNDDFETPRLDRAAYVFCVQKLQECYDGFDGIAKFVDESF